MINIAWKICFQLRLLNSLHRKQKDHISGELINDGMTATQLEIDVKRYWSEHLKERFVFDEMVDILDSASLIGFRDGIIDGILEVYEGEQSQDQVIFSMNNTKSLAEIAKKVYAQSHPLAKKFPVLMDDKQLEVVLPELIRSQGGIHQLTPLLEDFKERVPCDSNFLDYIKFKYIPNKHSFIRDLTGFLEMGPDIDENISRFLFDNNVHIELKMMVVDFLEDLYSYDDGVQALSKEMVKQRDYQGLHQKLQTKTIPYRPSRRRVSSFNKENLEHIKK